MVNGQTVNSGSFANSLSTFFEPLQFLLWILSMALFHIYWHSQSFNDLLYWIMPCLCNFSILSSLLHYFAFSLQHTESQCVSPAKYWFSLGFLFFSTINVGRKRRNIISKLFNWDYIFFSMLTISLNKRHQIYNLLKFFFCSIGRFIGRKIFTITSGDGIWKKWIMCNLYGIIVWEITCKCILSLWFFS